MAKKSPEARKRLKANAKANREAREAIAEQKAFEREYRARKDSESLFNEARGLRGKKRKKTSDAIVEHGAGIVFEADGRTPKRDANGEIVVMLNTRKGPSGRTRLGKNKSVGNSPHAEHTAQQRVIEYQETLNVLTAEKTGFIRVREVKCKDGSTMQVLSGDAQLAIKKGLTAADGTKVVQPATGLRGNPASKARSLDHTRPLLNPPSNKPAKPEMRPLERDLERHLPVPPIHRNNPPSPVKPIQGNWTANEDFPPVPSRKAHPAAKQYEKDRKGKK